MEKKEHPGIKNLKPKGHDQDHDECVRIGRLGGKKSVEVRRAKKNMQQQLKWLLEMKAPKKAAQKIAKESGITEEEVDNQMAVTFALMQKAMAGDTKAFELLRDTIGEKPIEKVQQVEPPKIELGLIELDEDK